MNTETHHLPGLGRVYVDSDGDVCNENQQPIRPATDNEIAEADTGGPEGWIEVPRDIREARITIRIDSSMDEAREFAAYVESQGWTAILTGPVGCHDVSAEEVALWEDYCAGCSISPEAIAKAENR